MAKINPTRQELSIANAKQRQKWVLLLICIGLAAGIFLAYEPIRYNGFVNYDDNVYVTENSNVNGGITGKSLVWALTQFHDEMWHPLTTLSHLLDCELYDLHPLGHHITNVLIHIANTLLLFLILRKMTSSIWPGAFVAAVFALHPLQVESVAWAAERKTVLSGLFWFLTIAVYIWYAKRPDIGRYILLFSTYALCIMTKPVVATLPLVLLLLDYWPLEHLNPGHPPIGKTVPLNRLLIEKAPLLALAAILCVLTLVAQQHGGVIVGLEGMPLKYRIGNAFISYITYIEKMICPANLAVLYPHPFEKLPIGAAVLCSFLFVAASVFVIYIGHKRKYAATGWLWYVGTLVPMVGLVQSGVQSMADRYMYLSMLGLLIMVAWFAKGITDKRPRLKAVVIVLALASLTTMIVMTRTQVRYWQNGLTLFEHTLKVTKNNAIAETNYGSALFKASDLDEAAEHFNNALHIEPAYPVARNNLGKVLLKQGKTEEAISCFNALSGHPQDKAEMYANLGAAYTQLGKYEPAIQNLTKAMELKPDNADVLNNISWLLVVIGNSPAADANKAIEYAQRACELTGYDKSDYLDTLAVAYAAAGKFPDAVATAEKALNAAKAAGEKNLTREIQNRLELYRADKPYREK